MNDLTRLWRRLRQQLWRTAQDERDLDDEIAFHLAREGELRADRGLDASTAHARDTTSATSPS